MWLFLLWLSMLALKGTDAVLPEGYIMEVTPHCGEDIRASPYITVVTDLKARIRAFCRNGIFEFNNTDSVNFHLPASYSGRDSGLCEFIKRANSLTYVVKIAISYGEPGQMISMDDEEWTVTCTFEARKSQETGIQNILDTLIAPPELSVNLGEEGNSSLTLQIVDVLDDDITGEDIDIGRKVRLRASSLGEHGETGLRPVSCDAIGNNTGHRYSILRAGCGDGLIFSQDQGFNITGLITRSPYFPVFHLTNDIDFKFQCNFTLCETDCDGTSCRSPVRQKRDTGRTDHVKEWYVSLETEPIHFKLPLSRKSQR